MSLGALPREFLLVVLILGGQELAAMGLGKRVHLLKGEALPPFAAWAPGAMLDVPGGSVPLTAANVAFPPELAVRLELGGQEFTVATSCELSELIETISGVNGSVVDLSLLPAKWESQACLTAQLNHD